MRTVAHLLARAAGTANGHGGWETETARKGLPRIRARRRFEAACPVDDAVWPSSIRRLSDTPAPVYWRRTDATDSEVVEQISASSSFHQHRVRVPRGYDALWVTVDYRITARDGDDRTRVVSLAHGRTKSIRVGAYARASTFAIWDHDRDETSETSGGTFAVSHAWRRMVVYLKAATAAGNDGIVRVWLDTSSDLAKPDLEISDHNHPLANQEIQFGLGSVHATTTFEIAECVVYDSNPLALRAYSAGWAAAPLHRIIADPVGSIAVAPSPLSAADGAPAGTVIGTVSRSGGVGDGTWSLGGALATTAEIVDSEIRLTRSVTATLDNGTGGTIGYRADSAGGAAAPVMVSLTVTSATTALLLKAPAGGVCTSGNLDTTKPFRSIEMKWRNTPLMAGEFNRSAQVDPAYAGTRTRAGLDTIGSPSDAAVIRVTSLGGGTGVGTLRWAATTTTDNDGNSIAGKAVIVIFDVSGHIHLSGALLFRQDNRWFAGQTAPQAANGSGGIFVHGRVDRRPRARHLIIEHIRFIDGAPRKHDDGALDPWADGRDLFHQLFRNCSFFWGVDETFAFNPRPGHRFDNCTVIDCMIAESARTVPGDKSDRGFGMYITRRTHRLELARTLFAGNRARSPGQAECTSAAFVNLYNYDRGTVAHHYVKHEWTKFSEYETPVGHTITHVGNVSERGPGTYSAPQSTWTHHYNLQPNQYPILGGRGFGADEEVDGAPCNYPYPPRNGHEVLDDPPLWPRHNFLPREDVNAHCRAHAGAWPGDRSSTERRIIDTWDAGGGLHYMAAQDRISPANFPDTRIADTKSAATPPTDPFAIDPSTGLTRIEGWLEARHIAVGGAPYEDFGKWLRFPWGGRIKIDRSGAVMFDPIDMLAGEVGVVEVTRADGSIVTATCTTA